MRIFDIVFSVFGIILLLPIIILIYIVLRFESNSPIYTQVRVGRFHNQFTLIKFRTMHLSTPVKPSHYINSESLTRFGSFLRKTKLDELPQFINVFLGDMSFVGPRPCLPTQIELLNERNKYNIYNYKPGITGLAQIKGIDMSTPKLLAETENIMLANLNIFNYFKIILLTIIGYGSGDRVRYSR